jgi:uncharacterized protein
MFEEPSKLILGFLTGIVFGVFLQKGQVAKYEKILGQLLLKDFTVLKIMATAVAVGTVGVNFLISRNAAELHIQEALLGRVVGGALLFGAGMAILGLCPGTTVAACGEGRRDAMMGFLGMIVGAGAYVVGFAALKPLFEKFGTIGKVTLPQLTNTSVPLWAGGVVIAVVIALSLLERRHPAHPGKI